MKFQILSCSIANCHIRTFANMIEHRSDTYIDQCPGCGVKGIEVPTAQGIDLFIEKTSSANSRQVGGGHYKAMEEAGGIQPWDFILPNRLEWAQGEAIAKIARWRSKGGIEDLEKTIHLLQKYIEVEKAKGSK